MIAGKCSNEDVGVCVCVCVCVYVYVYDCHSLFILQVILVCFLDVSVCVYNSVTPNDFC